MEGYDDSATLAALAKQNWRGVTTSDLTIAVLNYRGALEECRNGPPEGIVPQNFAGYKLFLELALADASKEIARRRSVNINYVASPDREIIQTIKDKLPIADVMDWYAEVFYNTRDKWTFKCTLHGDGNDKITSGVIYVREQRWWCFGCNEGGDVFDAVQRYERITLSEAIKKLATHLGIEARPLNINGMAHPWSVDV